VLLAAPLLAGYALSTMTPETIAMLTNKEVIAIDQDPLGAQGDRVWAEGSLEIWARPLADSSKAVGMFNRTGAPMEMTLDFVTIGITDPTRVRDLWAGKNLSTGNATYATTVPGHGAVLLKISK
jgi:alpha-galactosidase